MPSPLAHSAMALLIAPVFLRALPPEIGVGRKAALAGGIVFGTVAADLDIPLGFLAGADGFALHGGYTHSLVMAVIFAMLFAWWARMVAPVGIGRAWVVGALAYGSHLLLDAVNHGRGIMLLWPLTTERYASPVRIFYGVRHSDPTDWSHHLITLGTELFFIFVVFMVSLPLYARRGQSGLIPP